MRKYLSAPFKWFGGKHQLAPYLASLLPRHAVYVEVFGGGASLLFAKPRSGLEVYNDLDSGLVNFFRVLRDPDSAQELQRRLVLTPYARTEYHYCQLHRDDDDVDPIEKARMWYTAVCSSFGGNIEKGAGSWGYGTNNKMHNAPVTSFVAHVDNLLSYVGRLRGVQIEQLDALDLIQRYDSDETLFYCDPPYVHSTRRGAGYRHEMEDEQHQALLDALLACRGMVILSGYRHPMYDAALASWQRIDRLVGAPFVGRTRATGLHGDGAMRPEHMRTECIWIKPNTIQQISLFPISAEVS